MNSYVLKKEGFSCDQEELLANESLFHTANGYLGVRGCFEEGYPEGIKSIRGEYINAFYDIVPMPQAEALYGFPTQKQVIVNTCDTQSISIELDGEPFSLFNGTILSFSRELDMKRGWSVRRVLWVSPKRKTTELTFVRMASFDMLPLFTIQVLVEPKDWSGLVRFSSLHSGEVSNYSNPDDPRVGDATHRMVLTDRIYSDSSISVITAHIASSGLNFASAVGVSCPEAIEAECQKEPEAIVSQYAVNALAGKPSELIKYAVHCDSRRYGDDPARSAVELLKKALQSPVEEWYQRQAGYLEKFWNSAGLEIEGDESLALSLHFGLFQLLQAVGKDACSSIAAKGLSGEGYEGHYFWDTEMYVVPFFSLTMPEIAKNLINYRYETLPQAQQHARIMGHQRGALYAWRTIQGEECSGYYPSGSAQYHINGDVVFAIVQYYLVSKDISFIAEKAAEIVFETARLWMDVGSWHDGSFRINCVTGPDEYTCLVNNNYYTNAGAKYNLAWAAKFYHILEDSQMLRLVQEKTGITKDEIDAFEKAADGMLLLFDEERGINPQDDTFLEKEIWDFANTPKSHYPLLLHYHPLYINRFQVCKQADTVLAHFIHEDYQTEAVMRRSYDYYEKITTHDSSLSSCIFGIMAARLGEQEKAFHYFSESLNMDLDNTHHNTGDGLHIANFGGTYMGLVYGFAGLRIKDDGLHFRPSMPDGLTTYRFRFRYGKSLVEVSVKKSRAVFRMLEGEAISLQVYGKAYVLEDEIEVQLYRGIDNSER